jgi:hypothetical protein
MPTSKPQIRGYYFTYVLAAWFAFMLVALHSWRPVAAVALGLCVLAESVRLFAGWRERVWDARLTRMYAAHTMQAPAHWRNDQARRVEVEQLAERLRAADQSRQLAREARQFRTGGQL